MLFCHIQVAPFAHEKIWYMGLYFPRKVITSAKNVAMVETIKYLRKYMTICLILLCEKEAIYMWQNSILIFYINTFQREGVHFGPLYCSAGHYWSRLRMRVIGRRVKYIMIWLVGFIHAIIYWTKRKRYMYIQCKITLNRSNNLHILFMSKRKIVFKALKMNITTKAGKLVYRSVWFQEGSNLKTQVRNAL